MRVVKTGYHVLQLARDVPVCMGRFARCVYHTAFPRKHVYIYGGGFLPDVVYFKIVCDPFPTLLSTNPEVRGA